MKIALISAPFDTSLFRIGENLGVKYLAAYLERSGCEVEIYEPSISKISNNDLVNILQSNYDLLGFSIMFEGGVKNTIEIVKKLRSLGCSSHITIGGHYATFNYYYLLENIKEVDTIVRFEGEETLFDLVENLYTPEKWDNISGLVFRKGNQIVTSLLRPLIPDLDKLPFPKRTSTSRYLGDPHFFMITSRGCPHRCTFCSVPSFYNLPKSPAWRTRSAENIISEIQELKKLGAQMISFLDDEFLVGKKGKQRALELSQLLIDNDIQIKWAIECRSDDIEENLLIDLKKSGLQHIFIGVESGVQKVLDRFQKGITVQQNIEAIRIIKNAGLSLAIGFIMFDPYTSFDELYENAEFLANMQLASYKTLSNKVTVYKGSRLFDDLDSSGMLIHDELGYDFIFTNPQIKFVYNATRELLRPYNEIDNLKSRIQFRIDNSSLIHQNHGLVENFKNLEEKINFQLIELFNKLLVFGQLPALSEIKINQFQTLIQEEVSSQVINLRIGLNEIRENLENIE